MKFEETNLPLQERVEDLLSRLTLEEKFTMFTPFHPAIERLGLAAAYKGCSSLHFSAADNSSHRRRKKMVVDGKSQTEKEVGSSSKDHHHYHYRRI